MGVLSIDEDTEICETLNSLTVRFSHNCRWAHWLHPTRSMYREASFDIIFFEVCLPNDNGLDMLPEFMEKADPSEIIILTVKG
jgi:two-component system NtrC family response regulator